MTESHSSSVMLKLILSRRIPALLTRMSSPPKLVDRLVHDAPRRRPSDEMSSVLATAFPPAAVISSTTCLRRAPCRRPRRCVRRRGRSPRPRRPRCEQQRLFAPDAAPGARDDRDLAVEQTHWILRFAPVADVRDQRPDVDVRPYVSGQVAGELGVAAVAERGHALGEVGRRGGERLEATLELEASARGRSRSDALSSRFDRPSERVGPAASRTASSSGVVGELGRRRRTGRRARGRPPPRPSRPRRASPSPWRAAARRAGAAGTRRRRRRRGPTSRTTT